MDALTRLAEGARSGDQHALEAFVEAAYGEVWRLCAALVDRESAEDLAQEAFARAVSALPKFRGGSSARTWLLSIARHTCLDELRSRGRRRGRQTALVPGAVADEPVVADASGEVAAADLHARLGPERRAAFVLTQMLGLSYSEAAEVCGCPVGTIRSRVARARAELLEFLEGADHTCPPRNRSSPA